MKKSILLVCALIITLSVKGQDKNENQEATNSTYFIVRHAEKDRSNKDDKNPHLTKKGKKRAKAWRDMMLNFNIDAIYSTDYNRTRETADPLAESLGLKIKVYHPFKIDIPKFLEETKGKNVLIVGHSNTSPGFANNLIGTEVYPDMADDNNGNLYIVTLQDDLASHVLIKLQ